MPTIIAPGCRRTSFRSLNSPPGRWPVNATDTANPTAAANDILDGTQYTVTDDKGNLVTFELDCGPDVDMGNGELVVRDGMTFTVGTSAANSKTFEFDSGVVPVFANDGGLSGTLDDGTTPKTFTLTDNLGVSEDLRVRLRRHAEGFRQRGGQITAGANAQTVATAVVAAINGTSGFALKAALGQVNAANTKGRVSLIDDSTTVLPVGGGILRVDGGFGRTNPASGTILIPFEETWNDPVFQSILTAAPLSYPAPSAIESPRSWKRPSRGRPATTPQIDVGYAQRSDGTGRITFNNATVFDLTGMKGPATGTVVWTQRNGVAHGGNPAPLTAAGAQNPAAPNQEVVLFGAGDTARQIAQEIAAAVNKADTDFTPFDVTAVAEGGNVDLTHASLTSLPTADAPLTSTGIGPGGKITGMAFIGTTLYAVSDAGGFYEVVNYNNPEFKTWPDISNPADTHTPNEIQPIPNPNAAHLRYIGTIASGTTGGDRALASGNVGERDNAGSACAAKARGGFARQAHAINSGLSPRPARTHVQQWADETRAIKQRRSNASK